MTKPGDFDLSGPKSDGYSPFLSLRLPTWWALTGSFLCIGPVDLSGCVLLPHLQTLAQEAPFKHRMDMFACNVS